MRARAEIKGAQIAGTYISLMRMNKGNMTKPGNNAQAKSSQSPQTNPGHHPAQSD
jgi:hypothetical protein